MLHPHDQIRFILQAWRFPSGDVGGIIRFSKPNGVRGQLMNAHGRTISPSEVALIRERVHLGESFGLRFPTIDDAMAVFKSLALGEIVV